MLKDFETRFSRVDSFPAFLQEFAKEMNEEICAQIPTSIDEQINKYLYDPLKAFCRNGGKCSRPLTCLLGAIATKDNNCSVDDAVEHAMTAACAIEIFQDAALIHDDIADEAQTRRNAPCLHITEGIGPALNMGDFVLCLVDDMVLFDSNLEPDAKRIVLLQISEMKSRTIEGQAMDLSWARDERFDLTVEDYFKMATHKTAFYTCAYPLSVGAATTTNYTSNAVEHLFNFGISCGLAFQIKDDLLNVTNESTKDFALDITEGKRTLMVIHALENLDATDRAKLIEILSKKTTDKTEIDDAISLLEKAGSLKFAENQVSTLVNEALEELEHVAPSHARDILADMAKWCWTRTN